MSTRPEAMIVGGGPAGAALALRLAEAGRQAVLIERTPRPLDKVCGEFLSAEALLSLGALGCDPFALGAVPVREVRLSARRRQARVALPFAAASLSRRVLDQALLARAAEAGVDVRRGAAVRALERHQGGWRARLSGGEALESEAVFIATGKHDLSGFARGQGRQPGLIAFKMHFLPCRQAADSAHTVDLALFPGGYAGLEPTDGGRVNLCLLVDKRTYARVGRRWDSLLDLVLESSAPIAARLAGARPCRERPLAVGVIPFGHLRREGGAAWHLGDQVAVVPSFTGTGIALALLSARLAASTYLAGEKPVEYQRRLAREAGPVVRYGTWLSRLLVIPRAQPVLAAAAARFPGLLSRVASATRLSAAGDTHGLWRKEVSDVHANPAVSRFVAGGLRR